MKNLYTKTKYLQIASFRRVSEKGNKILICLIRKLREQGSALMKIKESTFVNDCFKKGYNAVIGVFLQTLFILFAVSAEAQSLFVNEKDGAQTAYVLSNIRSITFDNGDVTVAQNNATSDNYPLSGLRYISFDDNISIINKPAPAFEKNNLLLYPNPVSDILHINTINFIANTPVEIIITDLSGKMVFNKKAEANSSSFELNVSDLSRGFYICTLRSFHTIQSSRFVIK